MRKKRSESFFGMHFDFHARQDQTGIGSNCDPKLIGLLLDEVKPDYVQCDTKGHVGATSYPTKVGNQAAGIERDILRMWRDETAARDVALYAHHSGVWDNYAIKRHPDWAACNEKGEPSVERTSVFGPYADGLLIPQLLEMALDYGLDGVWVDGEEWAVIVDYSEHARKSWKKTHDTEPPKPGEKGYDEYLEFNRQGFRDYIRHYIDEVKAKAPDFQIASNWIYTSQVPERKTLPVDFISGDYSPSNSVNTARFESYCMMNQPHPWDLMAWGFNIQGGYHCVKELKQLCQEAAVVISVGGGFQFYNRQLVGTVQEWAIPMWAELAKFCRAREALCHKAKAVPQVAVIHSTKDFYDGKQNLFTSYGCHMSNDLRGTLFGVLDNQYSTEILMTHHAMDRDLSAYGMVIVPDVHTIEPELKEKLLAYAENGGKLVVSGPLAVRVFADELGIRVDGENDRRVLMVTDGSQFATCSSMCASISSVDAETVDRARIGDEATGEEFPTLIRKKLGKGAILGVPFEFGCCYTDVQSAVLRRFMGKILSEFEAPAVRVFGSSLVEVALCEKNGRRMVNLLNLAGPHADEKIRTFDEIPPLTDLTVRLACDQPPKRVRLEPDGTELDFTWNDGIAEIRVPRLEIHGVITVD